MADGSTDASTGVGVAIFAAGPLGPADAEAVSATGPLENDSRLDPSLLFSTVFTRDMILLNPFLFSNWAFGPSFAGVLIVAMVD
jgi:hypothetical protein